MSVERGEVKFHDVLIMRTSFTLFMKYLLMFQKKNVFENTKITINNKLSFIDLIVQNGI